MSCLSSKQSSIRSSSDRVSVDQYSAARSSDDWGGGSGSSQGGAAEKKPERPPKPARPAKLRQPLKDALQRRGEKALREHGPSSAEYAQWCGDAETLHVDYKSEFGLPAARSRCRRCKGRVIHKTEVLRKGKEEEGVNRLKSRKDTLGAYQEWIEREPPTREKATCNCVDPHEWSASRKISNSVFAHVMGGKQLK